MRIDNRGSSRSEFTRISASAKCWMTRGHRAPALASSCCGLDWLNGKEGVPLVEDSGWVVDCSFFVGAGGGGGRTMTSFAWRAHFGGGLRHPL